MRAMTRTLIVGLGVASLLAACARPSRGPVGSAAAVNPRGTSVKPTRPRANLHFAADGKCADKLAREYREQAAHRHALEKALFKNIQITRNAKAEHAPQIERWIEPIRHELLRLREYARPFDRTYGTFACPDRRTNAIFSSEELGRGLAALTIVIEKETGPLP